MKTILLVIFIGICPALRAGDTTALFQPGSAEIGPFPTNSLTTPDPAQQTGVRVNLAQSPACAANPGLSICSDTMLLNQLDGFSVNPRLKVCFSDSIDPGTLRDGVQLLPVGLNATPVSINQVVYDPVGKCVFAKPDQVLRQQTRYLLVVTDAVHDSKGHKIKEDKGFKDCLKNQNSDPYCETLSEAVDGLNLIAEAKGDLVSASLFTTMSATNWLEQARQFVDSHQPPVVLPAGNPSAFALANLRSMTWVPQDNSGNNTRQDIPLTALGGVEAVAFGLYLSPNFLNVSGPLAGSISVTPTNTPINPPVAVPGLPGNIPAGYVPISFHVFLPPASRMPAGGFPVVIYGHGLSDNQFGAPTYMASTLAESGFATLAIEIMGHGFGPGGSVQLADRSSGNVSVVATPGRGIALSPTGPIGSQDGCIVPGPLAIRDCARQTAVDLFALVQTIQETGGLGLNLNPARIYYVGQSFGATYGTMFLALEPRVKAAALNAAGGTSVDVSRLSPVGRQLGTFYLGTHVPFLLNAYNPNLPPFPPPPYPASPYNDFNENYALRDQPVIVNQVAGALPIQAAFEVADWLGMSGDPLGYAAHLPKPVLFQFALGDLEVPNPTESAVIRTAGAQASSWYLRFDKVLQLHPELLGVTMPGAGFPILPHRFLSNPTIIDPSLAAEKSLAMAGQQQIAGFFASDGTAIPDPNPFLAAPFSGMTLFEVPTALPEALNYPHP